MYKTGSHGLKYKLVDRSWRKAVDVRNYVNKKEPTNPMAIDLLMGKTIFAYTDDRNKLSYGSLYATAAFNNKVLRMYRMDDVDDQVFHGYVLWMDDR